MNLCDPKTLNNIMQAYGINPRKDYGQNFLTDEAVIRETVDSIPAKDSETILEIGPGMGALTRILCERFSKVVALEIDKKLLPVLNYTLNEYENVTVINEDVMKADLKAIFKDDFENGVSVCANLPYYITTPILLKLLGSELPFGTITLMVQKEVADKLMGGGGTKNSETATILSYYGRIEQLIFVPQDSFTPSPKVDSEVVRITPYKKRPVEPCDKAKMFGIIHSVFTQRRKTLANVLASVYGRYTKEEIAKKIESIGFPPDVRGERLTIADFAKLSDIL